jgi:hypothetical protein
LAVVGYSCGRLATRSRVARILKYVILTRLSLVLSFIFFGSVEYVRYGQVIAAKRLGLLFLLFGSVIGVAWNLRRKGKRGRG